ncbi:hypothetical protein E1B28_010731 [Marasmius oreades]|uniref:Uncharacterized protein n=1 Tax=Marasmius oreades TaxID=181124 RepID=A0A9P7RTD5_9AGAR|nr:uncharacterized protein E1B28_010731 [Marasmius oreades]KAG7089020.1 hypothetical protein E1B28_010731 [Marasmius oreades]
MQGETKRNPQSSSLEDKISFLETIIGGLKEEVEGKSKKVTSESNAKRPTKVTRAKSEETIESAEPTAIDLVFKHDEKGIRRIFKEAVRRYPLYEGGRPERCNTLPVPMFNMHICNRTGWERMLYSRISHMYHQVPSWKRSNRRLLYVPGCTVFVDDQRAVAWLPATQHNTQQNFSLKSLFETFYDETIELFYDNGLSSGGSVFYAGTYRCHSLNDLVHPLGFLQAGIESRYKDTPWTLTYAVINSQERAFSQRLATSNLARLIAIGDITFDFVALQCVGFDMSLYHALTRHQDSRLGSGHVQEAQEEPASQGSSTRKRRREEVTSDEDDPDREQSFERKVCDRKGKGSTSKRRHQ